MAGSGSDVDLDGVASGAESDADLDDVAEDEPLAPLRRVAPRRLTPTGTCMVLLCVGAATALFPGFRLERCEAAHAIPAEYGHPQPLSIGAAVARWALEMALAGWQEERIAKLAASKIGGGSMHGYLF